MSGPAHKYPRKFRAESEDAPKDSGQSAPGTDVAGLALEEEKRRAAD